MRPGEWVSAARRPMRVTSVAVVASPGARSTNDTPRSVRNRNPTRMLPPGSPPSVPSVGLMERYEYRGPPARTIASMSFANVTSAATVPSFAAPLLSWISSTVTMSGEASPLTRPFASRSNFSTGQDGQLAEAVRRAGRDRVDDAQQHALDRLVEVERVGRRVEGDRPLDVARAVRAGRDRSGEATRAEQRRRRDGGRAGLGDLRADQLGRGQVVVVPARPVLADLADDGHRVPDGDTRRGRGVDEDALAGRRVVIGVGVLQVEAAAADRGDHARHAD